VVEDGWCLFNDNEWISLIISRNGDIYYFFVFGDSIPCAMERGRKNHVIIEYPLAQLDAGTFGLD
jgi:hypothetical protein